MMASQNDGIVTDGLVFRLCGSRPGPDPNRWVDVIGGIPFSIRNCQRRNNGIYFDGTAYGACSIYKDVVFDENTCTLECAFKSENNADESFVIYAACRKGFPGLAVGFSKYYDSYISSASSNNRNLKLNYKSVRQLGAGSTVSVSKGSGIENLTNLSRTTGDYWGMLGVTLGQWQTNKAVFRGTIYEIRAYNRILTPEEVLKNQQHDIDLYFGGDNP